MELIPAAVLGLSLLHTKGVSAVNFRTIPHFAPGVHARLPQLRADTTDSCLRLMLRTRAAADERAILKSCVKGFCRLIVRARAGETVDSGCALMLTVQPQRPHYIL